MDIAYNLGHVCDLSTLFQAASSEGQSQLGQITFNQYIRLHHNVFDLNSNSFKCTKTGTYVFHISCELTGGRNMKMYLNGMSQSYALSRESSSHTGKDIISRTIVAKCSRDQVVSMELQDGQIYSHGDHYQLMAIGFLYQPKLASNISFAAYSSVPWSGNALSVLEFNIIESGNDDFDGVKFHVRKGGLFYVYWGAAVRKSDPYTFKLSLMRTKESVEEEIAAITGDTSQNNGYDNVGREVIVELQSNDTLHIRTLQQVHLYADAEGNQISFCGFMLYHI